MSLKKIVLLIISLAILAVVVSAMLLASRYPKIEELRVVFKDKAAVVLANLVDSVAPARRRPLTTIELEERLRQNLPVPFIKFSKEDWQWFWDLLYGKFIVDASGWPRRKRQLSREEIEDILINDYRRPFGSFNQRQWAVFWQRILKGEVFKG